MQFKTKLINIIGGPGIGKTLTAADIFVNLKKQNIVIEYVQEYAKHLVWRQDFDKLNNQYYVSTKQFELFNNISDKLDYIITDGPLIHGLYYNKFNIENNSDIIKTEIKILELMNKFNNINILLERNDKYNYEQNGRLQTLNQSKIIDFEIEQILQKHDMIYKKFKYEQFNDILLYIKQY